jgi:dihydrofolate reductase
MDKPIISIIVAHGENREIGGNNQLLWQLPSDLTRFKEITMGHPIIMGRKTHESIGRALPKRLNIVITRNPEFRAEGVSIVPTLDEAVALAKQNESEEIFIIGGGEIFRQALPMVDRLYITKIKDHFPAGDVFFPDYGDFAPVGEKQDGEENGLMYEYQVWERKS